MIHFIMQRFCYSTSHHVEGSATSEVTLQRVQLQTSRHVKSSSESFTALIFNNYKNHKIAQVDKKNLYSSSFL